MKEKDHTMKNLILATIAAAALAPAAFAMTPAQQLLSNADRAEIASIVPSADLSNLSTADAGALAAVLASDGHSANIGGQIRAILN
jgi:hypothetical protein